MASVLIDQYAVWIKPNQNYYKIGLRDTSGGMVYQPRVSGPEELSAIVDLLRNEDRCWYDPDANRFTVGFEPVGEEES
jgi:hypothetical protein